LEHICGVNAIADGQRLEFAAPTGLTIVYGDNGSGKTGYSKVMKHACRSREKKPPTIHRNLFCEGETPEPRARFTYRQDGTDRNEEWTVGADTSDELGSIALFDASCARAYVNESGELAYQPYGFGVFKELGATCSIVKDRLAKEAGSILVPTFTSFTQPPVVAAINAVMTQDTEVNRTALTTLATLSEEETAAVAILDAQLAKLKADDPVKQAAALKRLATSLDTATRSIAAAGTGTAAGLTAAIGAMELRNSTAKTAADASKLAFGEEPVQGVGGDQWKRMYELARDFSTQVAYPGEPFPYLGEDARCVLCQQELDLDARVRMLSFKTFIEDSTADEARKAAVAYQAVRAGIADAAKLVVAIDDTLLDLIEAHNPELAKSLRSAKASYAALSTTAAVADAADEWKKLALPEVDNTALSTLAGKLRGDAAELEKNSNAEEQRKLQERLDLLKERRDLGKSLESILQAAVLKAKRTRLQVAANIIETAPITRKAGEMMRQVITQELCDRLNRELVALNAGHLEVEFASRGSVGSQLHYLRFTKAPKQADLEEVLSEGEHRCVGIAAYLTELRLEGHASAIVLDDPVSSLDQRHRDAVARRLVEEAKHRQVVILTHDLAFMYALNRAATEEQIPTLVQAVRRTSEGTGVVSPDGDYPEEMPLKTLIKTRIPAVAEQVKQLDAFAAERRGKVVDLYDLIRVAWERVVEETILCAVVSPFDKAIHTAKLKGVQVEFEDCLAVQAGMGNASDIIEAHRTPAGSGSTVLPTNDRIAEDIQKLTRYYATANKRAQDVAKERKERLENPPSPN
jgi:energy-coupling factor transporter ATP-binding protein EcfA2